MDNKAKNTANIPFWGYIGGIYEREITTYLIARLGDTFPSLGAWRSSRDYWCHFLVYLLKILPVIIEKLRK